MPELPEVQTIISDLNKKIKGETITDFWSDHKKAVKNNFEDFVEGVKGRKILEAKRIGKNIFINLSGNKTIYIHLKMTGHLLLKSEKFPPKADQPMAEKVKNEKDFFEDRVNQYIHHIFYLGKNKRMEFSDLRKFGKIVLVDTDKVQNLKEIKSLGVDVMSKEFILKKFQEILNRKSARGGLAYGEKRIRDILMDQCIVSGIGNIYASEILFEARVHPERKVGSLGSGEIKKIFEATKSILKKAIKLRGTSDSDYRDTSGAPGGFQKVLKVYRKAGEKCQSCDTIIKRIKMGQRSAFVCPKCQK
jgi:formamidopyrimidine-DNA glycosylase